MKILIEKSGVVYFQNGYETRLMVNQEDVLAILEEQLQKAEYPTDYDGRFAGKVKIEISCFEEAEDEERKEAQCEAGQAFAERGA